ncbi:MAG TPA: hypothetical protein VJM15_00980 [Sphingomicrobium sp.]|nr:hypothetical protein [Sphingomicrobium sp.]
MRGAFLLGAFLFAASPAAGQAPKPLFASDETIRITIQGPISTLVNNRSSAHRQGTLTVGSETLPVTLSVRGLTRRSTETCRFPPLRVEFAVPPPPGSLFAGQRRLKLVTHCRGEAGFQQKVLLEYAAYRMYRQLTPLSLGIRLAQIDYRQADGRSYVQRLGFFLEDADDAAKRNGLKEIHAPELIPIATLSPRDAARYALFQHMIGNHDWAMRAGPKGDDCCHNSKLVGASGVAPRAVIPIPYDFDFSGLVDAPYATPPDELNIASVRQRVYRGYCIHNREAAAVAAQMRAARPQLVGTLWAIPELDETTRRRAANYLMGFFDQVATDAGVAAMLKRCL